MSSEVLQWEDSSEKLTDQWEARIESQCPRTNFAAIPNLSSQGQSIAENDSWDLQFHCSCVQLISAIYLTYCCGIVDLQAAFFSSINHYKDKDL